MFIFGGFCLDMHNKMVQIFLLFSHVPSIITKLNDHELYM